MYQVTWDLPRADRQGYCSFSCINDAVRIVSNGVYCNKTNEQIRELITNNNIITFNDLDWPKNSVTVKS